MRQRFFKRARDDDLVIPLFLPLGPGPFRRFSPAIPYWGQVFLGDFAARPPKRVWPQRENSSGDYLSLGRSWRKLSTKSCDKGAISSTSSADTSATLL